MNTREKPQSQIQTFVQPMPIILVVDDEPVLSDQLERLLTRRGYEVIIASSAEAALEALATGKIDLVLTDIKLPKMSGVELAHKIKETYPDVPVIIITGYGDLGTAIEVLKLGASDFILKPFTVQVIKDSIDAALEKAKMFVEIRHLRRSLAGKCEFAGIISKTPEMQRVLEIIRMVADSDATVVVEGETGTGKELVASAIHAQSLRRNGSFVTINCAGLPESLLESELFGYERGAFTGAVQARAGKIELADGGTLFLDEVESMSLAMQAKLLRVLEDRRVQRLGGTRWIRVDCRVIVASNVPLKDLVARGQLRSDIYYRINVVPISLMPLRLRREDIPLLVHDFLNHHPTATDRGIRGVTEATMKKLMRYSWPGNVRELQNVLERAVILTKGTSIAKIELQDGSDHSQSDAETVSPTLPFRQWLKLQEKQYILRQVEASGGKVGLAAKSSGVDLKTLYRKMRLYGIDKKDFKLPVPRSQAN